MEEAGNVRLHADGGSVHPHEQVVHGGVGAHAQPQNAPGVDTGGLAEIGDNGNQGLFQDSVLQLLLAAGTALLDNAVDHVRTVANLTIAGGTLGQQLAAFQVGEHHGDGGGANVDGAAHDGGVVRGADLHAVKSVVCQFALDADGEMVLPEGMGQLYHDGEGNVDVLHAESFLNGPGQPLVVGHGIVQCRLCHGDDLGAVAVFKMDAAGFQIVLTLGKNRHFLGAAKVGGLHAGLVGAGNIRHEHGAVGAHLGRAGQPPAVAIFFIGDMAAPGGFQVALHELHAAFAAGAVTGAGGVDGHVGPTGQLQQIISVVAFDDNGACALDLEGYFHGIKFLSRYCRVNDPGWENAIVCVFSARTGAALPVPGIGR